mmetsp:Transcript_4178/g.6237  ORF Transcript_4178/g.6237 Transcript_4178/m.6237 type:complete len:345 (-) Transcript_4178:260-1294(-)
MALHPAVLGGGSGHQGEPGHCRPHHLECHGGQVWVLRWICVLLSVLCLTIHTGSHPGGGHGSGGRPGGAARAPGGGLWVPLPRGPLLHRERGLQDPVQAGAGAGVRVHHLRPGHPLPQVHQLRLQKAGGPRAGGGLPAAPGAVRGLCAAPGAGPQLDQARPGRPHLQPQRVQARGAVEDGGRRRVRPRRGPDLRPVPHPEGGGPGGVVPAPRPGAPSPAAPQLPAVRPQGAEAGAGRGQGEGSRGRGLRQEQPVRQGDCAPAVPRDGCHPVPGPYHPAGLPCHCSRLEGGHQAAVVPEGEDGHRRVRGSGGATGLPGPLALHGSPPALLGRIRPFNELNGWRSV